jgi:predicted nucleic acid-binding protein
VNKVVIDASIAIKWVVEEAGTANALALLKAGNRRTKYVNTIRLSVA